MGSLNESREKIRDALFNSRDDLILKLPPGVGKTTSQLEYAEEKVRSGKIVICVVPNHALISELASKVNCTSIRLVGRNRENCKRFDEVKASLEKGFEAKMICKTCIYENKCKYWKDLKKALNSESGLVFCTPTFLPLALFRWEQQVTDVIFDERLENVLKIEKVALSELESAGQALNLTFSKTLVHYARKLGENLKEGEIIFLNTKQHFFCENQQEERESLWQLFRDLDIDPDQLREELINYAICFVQFFRDNWEQLWQWFKEGHSYKSLMFLYLTALQKTLIGITRDKTSQIFFVYAIAPEIPQNIRVLISDYCAIEEVVEKIFQRPFKVLKEKIPLKSPIKLLTYEAGKQKVKNSPKAKFFYKTIAKAIAKRLLPGKYLLFAYKELLPELEEIKKEVHEGVEVEIFHHFGREARGVNTFQGWDGVIVLGRPIQNIKEWRLILKVLDLPIEYQKVIDELSYRETAQEIGRLRPHLREEPLEIWIVGNFKKEKLLEHFQTEIQEGRIITQQQLLQNLTKACLKVFGFADPFLIRMLIGSEKTVPGLREEFLRCLREKYSEKLEELFSSFVSSYQDLDFLFVVNTHSSPLFLKIKDISMTLSLPAVSACRECVSEDFGGKLNLGRNWWFNIRKSLSFPDFGMQYRTPQGGWTTTVGLGDKEAFEVFYCELGFWEVTVRWRAKGLSFYLEEDKE